MKNDLISIGLNRFRLKQNLSSQIVNNAHREGFAFLRINWLDFSQVFEEKFRYNTRKINYGHFR